MTCMIDERTQQRGHSAGGERGRGMRAPRSIHRSRAAKGARGFHPGLCFFRCSCSIHKPLACSSYGDERGRKRGVESKHSVLHSCTKLLLLLHSLIDLWAIIGRLSLSLTYGGTELLSRFSSLYS